MSQLLFQGEMLSVWGIAGVWFCLYARQGIVESPVRIRFCAKRCQNPSKSSILTTGLTESDLNSTRPWESRPDFSGKNFKIWMIWWQSRKPIESFVAKKCNEIFMILTIQQRIQDLRWPQLIKSLLNQYNFSFNQWPDVDSYGFCPESFLAEP